MNKNETIRQFLKDYYWQLKKRNPMYSKSAFAKKMGIYPSALSEILSGKRSVSKKIASRIAKNLNLSPREKQVFLNGFRNHRTVSLQEEKRFLLTQKQFEVISHPVHYAILSLINTEDFQANINWIASRLPYTKSEVKSAINNLFDLNIIAVEDGKIIRLKNKLSTSEDIKDISIQNAYSNDLSTIEKQMEVDVNFRDYSSMTLPLSPSLIPEVKKILRRAQDEISQLARSEKATEVYKLNNFFYPLTSLSPLRRTQ